MGARYFGVTQNLDLDPSLIKPDVRPLRYRMGEALLSYGDIFLKLLLLYMVAFPFANKFLLNGQCYHYFELVIATFLIVFTMMKKVRVDFLFRKPIKEGDVEFEEGDGLIYFGNDNETHSSIWMGKADMSVHLLVFGSTGSGKSRFLLGLLYQAMLVGTGVMYVDGKGDSTVFWLVYSFCRRLGREDDLLVINYLTGGENIQTNSPYQHQLSNTNNPMSYGTADNLNSLIVGLMREAGSDGMWKGRARTMLKGLLNALVYKRDHENLNLDIMEIRNWFALEKVYSLSRDPNLDESAKGPLKKYLIELPGFSEEQASVGDISSKAMEQHAFLTMQLSEVMSDLSETYGFIFGAPLGEIDFKDVVFNRRILFVLLPALEKDPDALEGLGKLVVSGVRSALAPALGNRLEGTKREVLDTKPTNSKVPFLLILDEYGYYSVNGFAVVAAQARSLGVSVTFAGQDYPSFKSSSAEEAASTVANTNITITMKLEDPEDTFKLIEARGGDAEVATSAGQESKGGFKGYSDQKQTRVEVRKRINLRDLVTQKPGEAHLIFGDTISRCRFFYYDPFSAHAAKLNSFLMVDTPKKSLVRKIKGVSQKLGALLEGKEKPNHLEEIPDNGLRKLFADVAMAEMFNESLEDSVIHALGMVEVRERLKDIEIAESADKAVSFNDDDEGDEGINIDDNVAEKIAQDLKGIGAEVEGDDSDESNEDEFDDDSEEIRALIESFDDSDRESILQIIEDGVSDVDDQMVDEARAIESSFKEMLEESIKNTVGDDIYSSHKMSVSEQLGVDEDDADDVISEIDSVSQYPTKPVPSKMEQSALKDTLASILAQIESGEDE